MSNKLRICLLISGALGFDALVHLYKKHSIICVFTDWQSKEIIHFSKENNISLIIGNLKSKSAETWQSVRCDLLLSVNYLFIINEDLISIAKHAINIHGSLLPKYRGRTPHVWAIINGEKKTGVTVHCIDKGVDSGDIIIQKEINIEENDSGAAILIKFKELYPHLINELLEKILTNSIKFEAQNHSNATYFGKRTPESGLVNWDWFRERIRDWIRAQTDPYPGAFFFYDGIKVTVHQAVFSNLGMNAETANGTILEVNKIMNELIVKTPNGCITLKNLRCERKIDFKINTILT